MSYFMESSSPEEVLRVVNDLYSSDPTSQRIIQNTLGESLIDLRRAESELDELKDRLESATEMIKLLAEPSTTRQLYVMSSHANRVIKDALEILSN